MHDIRLIRNDPAAFDAALARRGAEPVAARFGELDDRRREVTTRLQEAQNRRNEASKAFAAKSWEQIQQVADALSISLDAEFSESVNQLQAGKEAIRREVGGLKQEIFALEANERTLADQLRALLAPLPNLPAPEVPEGEDESGNVEVKRWGKAREFAFAPQEHADLGPPLGLEFDTAVAMSGSRFAFLRGPMARLQRALGQFMLDLQTTQRGYTECAPPLLVKDDALFGTGQLPKFEEDLFQTAPAAFRDDVFRIFERIFANQHVLSLAEEAQPDFRAQAQEVMESAYLNRRWLIPTAEVSLTNSVREQILGDLSQPIRLTALTPCFRSEAGAAGKDTRGFIRQHQFEKVELVTICREDHWQAEHEHMVTSAEAVLEALELPYRRMLLCAGDMGATAKKTFDLEVWLPGQGAWREISSVSWCGDYQARRMNARYRPEGQKGTAFVHTLNGSGLAVGRTLVAVLENYQQEDGSVTVPTALVPYTGGMTSLTAA